MWKSCFLGFVTRYIGFSWPPNTLSCVLMYVAVFFLDLTQHDLLTLSALDDKTVSTTEFTEATHLLKNDNVKNTSEATLHSEATPQLIESGDVKTVTKRSSLHAFTVALALSVHSVFEGLALGLEEETGQVQIYCVIIFIIEVDRYHFLPIISIQVFVLKLSADSDYDTDTKH